MAMFRTHALRIGVALWFLMAMVLGG